MAPKDDSPLGFLLAEIRANREEQNEFRSEMRESLRANRQDSHDFRKQILERVDNLETKLAVKDAIEVDREAQLAKHKTQAAWLIGTLVTVASIVVPLLWSVL